MDNIDAYLEGETDSFPQTSGNGSVDAFLDSDAPASKFNFSNPDDIDAFLGGSSTLDGSSTSFGAGLLRTAKDTGVALLKAPSVFASGLVELANLGQSAVRATPIGKAIDFAHIAATGKPQPNLDQISEKLLGDSLTNYFTRTNKILTDLESGELEQKKTAAAAIGADNDGFLDEIKTIPASALYYLKNPDLTLNVLAESSASMLGMGGFIKASAEKAFKEALKKTGSEAAAKTAAAKAGLATAVPTNALIEGGHVAHASRTAVLEADEDALLQMPLYRSLLEKNNHDREQARSDLADVASQIAFSITAPVSGAATLLTGGGIDVPLFGGDAFNKGFLGFLKSVGKEGLEEALQEGPANVLGENIAKRYTLDEKQKILEGLGAGTGMGLATGGLMGGGVHATGSVIRGQKEKEPEDIINDVMSSQDVDSAIDAADRILREGVPDPTQVPDTRINPETGELEFAKSRQPDWDMISQAVDRVGEEQFQAIMQSRTGGRELSVAEEAMTADNIAREILGETASSQYEGGIDFDSPTAKLIDPEFQTERSRNISSLSLNEEGQDLPEGTIDYKPTQPPPPTGTSIEALQAQHSRQQSLPENFQDPRLARAQYRQFLKDMSMQIVKGGGITLTGGEFSAGAENVSVDKLDPVKRTKSQNPDWFQSMRAEESGLTVEKLQRAISKTLEGEKLGVGEARWVTSLMDMLSSERMDQVDYARTQLEQARKFRNEAARGLPPIEAYQQDIDNAGEIYEEQEYDPEWHGNTRTLYELLGTAKEIDSKRAYDIFESGGSDATVAARLAEIIHREKSNEKDTVDPTAAIGAESVQGQRQAGSQAETATERSTEEVTPTEDIFTLYTEEDLRARKQDETERQRQEREAEQKAKADEERDQFTLTGSEREADEAAARGQQDLLSQSVDTAAPVAESQKGDNIPPMADTERGGRSTQQPQPQKRPVADKTFESEQKSARLTRVEAVEDDYRLPNIGKAVPPEYIPKEASQKTVKIYRGVPDKYDDAQIRPGDWVSLSREYAEQHGTGETGASRVVEMEVPAEHVAWAGTDMNEWFYAPPLKASPEQTPRTQGAGQTPRISDFGEKLEGARKDYAQKLKDAKEHDPADVPLSQSWPEPNYSELLDQGVDPWVVGFIHAARDEIPQKPRRGWKLKRYTEDVTALRNMAEKLINGDLSKERVQEKLDDPKFRRLKDNIGGRAELYQAVGHDHFLKRIRLTLAHYSMLDGVKYDPPKEVWQVEQNAKKTTSSNMPRTISQGETKEAAIADFQKKVRGGALEQERSKQVRFDIISKRDEKNKAWIAKKVGKDWVELEEFAGERAIQEAREYLQNNQAALEKKLDKMKEVPAMRRDTNAPRIGINHRNGADVTPEQFSEAFGFRGVQFGNWVENDRRQQDLNETYDALMDLAGILNIPARALSLNGELGLAFGARGKGGTLAPKAHYEPDTVVINLTKKQGAGSLAHEWFHSLDNYFSRARKDKAGYLTEKPFFRGEGVRPEMVEAFKQIQQAVNRTSLQQRSSKLDRTRTKLYWSTGREMAARSFESYIVAKMQDQGQSNDYLANIVSEDYWNAAAALGIEKEGTYPYPEAAEIPVIRAAFDSFFNTVEHRETEQGVALYSRGDAGAHTSFERFAVLGEETVSLEQTLEDATAILGFDSPFDVAVIEGMPLGALMRFNLDTRVVEINHALSLPRWQAAQAMVEEVLHGVDVVAKRRTISASSTLLDRNGTIRREAENAYQNSALSEYLRHPFNDSRLTESEIKAELFARLGVVYLGEPQLMREVLPDAYRAYHSIFRLERESPTGDVYVRRPIQRARPHRSAQILSGYRPERHAVPDAARPDRQGQTGAGLGEIRRAVARALQGKVLGQRVQFGSLESSSRHEIREEDGVQYELFSGAGETSNQTSTGRGNVPVSSGLPGRFYVRESTRKIGLDVRRRVKNVQYGSFRSAYKTVTTNEEAAHVLSPLRKNAQETMLALVTDKNHNILGILEHSIGTIDGAGVYPSIVSQHIHSIDGAAHVWFAHNHPSGVTNPSGADKAITEKLHKTLEGTGVKARPMLVVGPDLRTFHAYDPEHGETTEGFIPPGRRTLEVPVYRRQYRGFSGRNLFGAITSPGESRRFLEGVPKSGILLLDNRHFPVGWLDITAEEMMRLRTEESGRGISSIIRAINEVNAAAIIIKSPGREEGQNLARALKSTQGSVRLLDNFFVNENGDIVSASEKGIIMDDDGVWYSKAPKNRLQSDHEQRNRELAGRKTITGSLAKDAWAEQTRARRGRGKENPGGRPDRGVPPEPWYRGSRRGTRPANFDLSSLSQSTGSPTSGLGVFFTESETEAGQYGPLVETLHLDLRNPKIVYTLDLPEFASIEEAVKYRESLIRQGYDGIILHAKDVGAKTHIIVFEPDQVIPVPKEPLDFYRRSESPAPAGFSTSEARSAIESKLGLAAAKRLLDGENAPLTIVATELGLPRHLDDGGVIRGVHDPRTGKTYLVARNLNAGNLRGTLLHEIGVHHGLVRRTKDGPGLLSEKRFNELVANLKRLERFGDTDTKMAITQARMAVEEAGTPESQMDEKLVAYTIDRHANNQNAPKGIKGWLRKVLQALKIALFRIGAIRNLTLDDMVALAEGAAKKVRGGRTEKAVHSLDITDPMRDSAMRGQPLFARSQKTKVDYEKRIDELFAGAEPNNTQGVRVLDKSDILAMLGMGNYEVILAEKHAVSDGRFNHPRFTAEDWKKVPYWMDNPVAVFERDDGNLTLIAPKTKDGELIIVGLEPGRISPSDVTGKIKYHLLLTAYNKDAGKFPARRMFEEGGLLYLDTKKSPEFQNSGHRLPSSSELRGYGHKIYTERDLVKYRKKQEENQPHYARGEGQRPSDEELRRVEEGKTGGESAFEKENRRIREEDKKLWDSAKKILRRQFAQGGLLPQSVFKEKIERDSQFEVVEFDVRHLIGVLERAIKNDYGKAVRELSQNDLNTLSNALGGEIKGNVKENTKVALVAMRQYIDHLSREYRGILFQQAKDLMTKAQETGDARLVEEAAQRVQLMEIIAGNEGQYVHRSYQAFDDPKWHKKVPTDVLDNARTYLIDQYMENGEDRQEAGRLTEVTLNEILKNGTAYESMEGFIKESKLGAKDLSVLKKRKQIAPEIRALLGEYKDPRINFAKTATKMGRLIWNQRFLDKVRETGMGAFLFEGKNRPPEATVQIAAEGSEVYAPLNGLWTFPEVNQAFKDALGREQMAAWYRWIVQANGAVKFGKTVLSPTTAARNWQSAFFFTMANGHFDLTHMSKSVSGLREYFTHHGEERKMQYLRRLKELGVVYDTPYAGEMMRLLDDSRIENMLEGHKGTMAVKDVLHYAQRFYQYGDDFWKIIGFENEKRLLMKHAGMTEAQAEKEAAERVRNTYPTYSMVGRAMHFLRRLPVVGTFVSFPSEIIRTSVNIVGYIAKDMKTPGMRPLAVRRAVGLSIVAGFAYALQAISKAMFDIDDDDEEAVRLQAAPWQRNSNLFFTGRDEKGNITYIDLSFLDPYNYWKRPINAMMRDQPWEDAMTDSLKEALAPFLGTDIAFGALFEIAANKKESGGEVYKEHDLPHKQLADITDHLRKAIQPGIASNLERTWKALQGETSPSGKKYDLGDEALSWIGWRVSTLDPKVALYYRAYDFKDAKADASRTLSEALNSPNEVSDSTMRSAYERSIRIREEAYQDMFKLVEAAKRSGMNNIQIMRVLKSNNVSREDITSLIKGRIPPWKPSNTAERNAMKRAEALYDDEAKQKIRQRYRSVRTIDAGYP